MDNLQFKYLFNKQNIKKKGNIRYNNDNLGKRSGTSSMIMVLKMKKIIILKNIMIVYSVK